MRKDMIHCKRNKRRKEERLRFQSAVRQVLRKKEGLRLRDREVSRYSHGRQHPWAAFLAREKNFHSDEVYNLDVTAVLFLAPRLRLLIKGIEQCGATPVGYKDIPKDETAWEVWHEILKKIQFAFDTLESGVDDCGVYELSHLSSKERENVDEGLNLFGKYMLRLCV